MKKVGIIDIGSNSLRMVVFQLNQDGSFKLIDEVKESVRLGESATGSLSEDKMNSARETLRFFLDLSKALMVEEIICVATEAVRKADNRDAFKAMIQNELGLNIRILSGEEEAYYDYIGVSYTLEQPDCLIMDIGGSSTELVRVIDHRLEKSISLPFGALTISNMFQLENSIDEKMKAKLHQYLFSSFNKIDWIYGAGPLVGIGGSFRNAAKIDRKLKKYPLDISHNYQMSDETVIDIYQLILSKDSGGRKQIKGLSKDRADILPGAMAEMAVLLEMTGIKNVVISGSGLREGLFYDWLFKGNQSFQNVLSFSTKNIMNIYGINQTHAKHIWEITLQIYQQLGSDLGIEQNCYDILKTAAMLHDIGINVSYYDHHKHTFYEMLNCQLYGLKHKELIMSAYIAALHRDSELNMASAYRSMLSDDDMMTVRKLGVLLRIAESLDRRQNGNVYKITSTVEQNSVKIYITAKSYPGLELKDVQGAVKNFQKVFEKELVILEEKQNDYNIG